MMKMTKVLLNNLLVSVLAFLPFQALASIPTEIQPELQKRFASGDFKELENIYVTQGGVTSSLLSSDVDISEILKLLANGDTALLNAPSLSYRPQLAGICRGGGANADACAKWMRSPEYKALERRQEREDNMKCSPDKVKMSSMFGVFCIKDPMTEPDGPTRNSGDGSKAFREYYRWYRQEQRDRAECGPHKTMTRYGCEFTG